MNRCCGRISSSRLIEKSFNARFSTDQSRINVQGNLSTAKVIFIGDRHYDRSMQHIRKQFINDHALEGDIYLNEGSCRSKKLTPEFVKLARIKKSRPDLQYIKQGIEMWGWENFEHRDKFSNLLRGAYSDIISNNPTLEKLTEDQEKIVMEFNDACHLVNQALVDTVKDHLKNLKPGQRIFVSSGRGHLLWDKPYCNILAHFKEKEGFTDCAYVEISESELCKRNRNILATNWVGGKKIGEYK